MKEIFIISGKWGEMPKVAYSEEDRQRIRSELVKTGLELMSRQGSSIRLWNRSIKKSAFHAHFFIPSFRPRRI